jgi:hypothetical protein
MRSCTLFVLAILITRCHLFQDEYADYVTPTTSNTPAAPLDSVSIASVCPKSDNFDDAVGEVLSELHNGGSGK